LHRSFVTEDNKNSSQKAQKGRKQREFQTLVFLDQKGGKCRRIFMSSMTIIRCN